MNASIPFQQECARLQKGIVLEKCRTLLLTSGPSDPNWRWAAEYISKYGEPATPTGVNVNLEKKSRPIEAMSLADRVRAARLHVQGIGQN